MGTSWYFAETLFSCLRLKIGQLTKINQDHSAIPVSTVPYLPRPNLSQPLLRKAAKCTPLLRCSVQCPLLVPLCTKSWSTRCSCSCQHKMKSLLERKNISRAHRKFWNHYITCGRHVHPFTSHISSPLVCGVVWCGGVLRTTSLLGLNHASNQKSTNQHRPNDNKIK